jgi:hypothetical protein
MSLWLERRGTPALHGSAVVVDGRAIAFLSHKGGGKSTLASAFLQNGYPLLTDDVLAVERSDEVYFGCAGYPEVRLWPTEAEHFLDRWGGLEVVHPGHTKLVARLETGGLGPFCEKAKTPLASIYLLDRRAAGTFEIEIAPVSTGDAAIALVSHSFAAVAMKPLGLQVQRLDFFAQLVKHVPVRTIAYSGDLEFLPHVRGALLRDLRKLV